MALRRYTHSVDGTIPVQALLYNDEELFATQDTVGIYDGTQKSMDHQNGTLHITSHRLFYIDAQRPESRSFEMALSYISQTEHYAGLFKSSPKVTCHLSGDPGALGSAERGTHAQYDSWECQVCAYRNPPGLSPTAARICALCGVPRTAVPPPVSSVSSHHSSSSLPSSALSSSTALAPELPLAAGRKKPIACPACTFLNHPYLRSCEICSTDLSNATLGEFRSAPSTRPITPDVDDANDDFVKMMKVSFRKGGDKHCYAVLKRSLKTKAWENGPTGSLSLINTANNTDPDNSSGIGRSGISGILRTVENSAKGRETHMRDALQDLEALMVKAKDMVRLAAELNEKLTAATAASTASAGGTSYGKDLAVAEPEEATFIRSSLSQLGLQISDTPVTLDMMKDEREWYNELARELARVLQGTPHDDIITSGMMKDRGIIALDEVWGGWNRARGVALIPPSTFLQVLPYLRAHTRPVISQRVFPSGLNVLHTPPYTTAAFAARLSSFLMFSGPKTALEISREEQLTVALIAEMIDATEADGGVCRDDSSAAIVGGGSGTGVEVRWWSNVFVGYIWDGQND